MAPRIQSALVRRRNERDQYTRVRTTKREVVATDVRTMANPLPYEGLGALPDHICALRAELTNELAMK
jgi:hypothetical protein